VLYLIVVWVVATGTLKIINAIALHGEVENAWLLVCSSALSVLLGVILAALASSDLPALASFVGIFAIVVGMALIVFAFRTRDRQRYGQVQFSGTPNCSLLQSLLPLENGADSAFRVMVRNTTITLRILFPVSRRLFGEGRGVGLSRNRHR
jgi:hypothetical protein